MAAVQENPASRADPPAAAAAKDASAEASSRTETMTIDELESAAACCTLCPPRIRCLCCKSPDLDEVKAATKGFFGSKRRKCTDVLCIILFAIFWGGMAGIGGYALSSGDPFKILYGTDYRGKVCGADEGVKDKKLTAYPRIIDDFILNSGTKDPTKWNFYGVCVDKCPGRLSVLCNNEAAADIATTNASQVRWCLTDGLDGTEPVPRSWCETAKVEHNCWVVPLKTQATLFRCVPIINSTATEEPACIYPPGVTDATSSACLVKRTTSTGVTEAPAQDSQILEQLATAQSVWSRYFGDISRAFIPILLCSVVVAIVLSFLFLILLQYCTWVIVVATLFLTFAGLAAAAGYSLIRGGVFEAPGVVSNTAGNLGVNIGTATSETTQTAFAVLGYVFVALTVLALVLIVVLRNAIATTVSTIVLASSAVQRNALLLLVPLANTAGIVALLAWWAYSAAALMSVTTPVDIPGVDNTSAVVQRLGFNLTGVSSAFKGLEQDDVILYMQFYNLFGLLWTGQFILYMGFLTMSGTAASWYFGRNKGECAERGVPVFNIEDEASPCCGLCSCSIFRTRCCLACHRSYRYHTGSAAFAALIVAIIAMIRLIVAYIQKKLKDTANGGGMIGAIMCYVQYCLTTIDCLVRMLSRNAFVFVAIKGHSFIPATGKALSFILGNLGTFSALNALSAVILFLGKLLIAGCAAGACWALLESAGSTYEVTSSWLPASVTFVFAYLVAAVFMDVFDSCIDTILISYVMDEAENGRRMHAVDRGDGTDIGADVDNAKGVHEGTAKPKARGGCAALCCCCCGGGRSTAVGEEGVELPSAPAGGAATT